MSNKLILRTQASPYGDETKGSVLSQAELDNNFIFLKGLDINTVNLDGTTLQLNRLNGDVLSVSLDNFVGPSGAAGADGPAGPAGPAGANGVGGGSVTAATYDDSTGILTLENNDNTTINVSGFFKSSDDKYINTFTFNTANYDLTVARSDGWSETRSLSILATDMTVTGGTYSSTTGVVTFTNNSGGTFNVSGFTSGYTNIYTSAATYNSVNGDINLSFTDPSKNLTITGVTSIYNGNGSLQNNRIVDLSGKTLSFSSSTNPNTLVMSGGNVGMGVSNPTSKLHISATTNPVKIEGLTAVSATTKIVATNANNELVNFSGTVRSIPYFTSAGVITHSPTFTYTDSSARNLQIDDGDLSRSSTITFAGGRGSITAPAGIGSGLILQAGLSNPFDQTKSIVLRNGPTNYVSFTSSGAIGGDSGHTSTFSSTVSMNIAGIRTSNWGLSGIATRVLSNTYTDSTTATTIASETVASSFAIPTFVALTGRTYSALTNVYIAGAPIAGTNVTGLTSYALKVNAGTTYFGGNVTLSGISTGTTSQLLTRESNGNVSFRNLGDVGVISSGNTTLYWYKEFSTPPATAPVVTATGSIALGNSAEARDEYMFVIGDFAGYNATGSSDSNFIGASAGYGANDSVAANFIGGGAGLAAKNTSYSNFIGASAGEEAQGSSYSNFIGNLAGWFASGSSNSNFIGYEAGKAANDSIRSNFIGYQAGEVATGVTNSNLFGYYAGRFATDSDNSNFIGASAGYGANDSSGSNFIGQSAGYQASGSSSSNFVGDFAGNGASGSLVSNFIGNNAGQSASNSISSNFIGSFAGYQASGSSFSNFIGSAAGSGTTGVTGSNFIGDEAGRFAIGSDASNFIGSSAGLNAINSNSSNFIGQNAGYQASGSSNSNFIGQNAGFLATNSFGSNFIGQNAGNSSSGSTYSNFIGQNAGSNVAGVVNSIMIGTDAGSGSSASNVIALGTEVAKGNGLSGQFIISNSNLPSYVNRAAATAAITIGVGAVTGNTYMYYNQTTFAIEGVRL